MATTTPSSRLDHLKICMDCSGEGTRHVTDSGKGSLPIRRTVTCARCDGEGLIYVGPEEGREEALRRLRGGRGGGEASGGGRALAAAVDLKEAGDAAYGAQDYAAAVAKYDAASQLDRAYLAPVANRAGAYLKMGRWRDCRRDCARVVAAAARGSDLHLRACLRRAVASEKLGGAEALRAGLADLDVLLKYQPGHPALWRLACLTRTILESPRPTAAAVEELALGGLGRALCDAPPPAPVELLGRDAPRGRGPPAGARRRGVRAATRRPPPPPAAATKICGRSGEAARASSDDAAGSCPTSRTSHAVDRGLSPGKRALRVRPSAAAVRGRPPAALRRDARVLGSPSGKLGRRGHGAQD